MNSFPKNLRLLSSPEFRRVLDFGSKAVKPELVVFCLSRNEGQTARRLGLIVSKKVGNAVVRNQVKRRLREIFRQTIQSFDQDGLDVVIIAREQASRASASDLLISWQQGLKRAKETLATRAYRAPKAGEATVHAN